MAQVNCIFFNSLVNKLVTSFQVTNALQNLIQKSENSDSVQVQILPVRPKFGISDNFPG